MVSDRIIPACGVRHQYSAVYVSDIGLLSRFNHGCWIWKLYLEVDAFEQWCQRRILRIHYSQHVTNAEVRRRTGCLPLSEIIRSRRLNWFGHVARASPELDHRRALYAAVHGQPRDWK